MDKESGICIKEPEEKKVSEMPEEYKKQVREFLESLGISCPPLDTMTTHLGAW